MNDASVAVTAGDLYGPVGPCRGEEFCRSFELANKGPSAQSRRARPRKRWVVRHGVGHTGWIGSRCDLYVTYRSEKWSERLDSNQRPPAPKRTFVRCRATGCDNSPKSLMFMVLAPACTETICSPRVPVGEGLMH